MCNVEAATFQNNYTMEVFTTIINKKMALHCKIITKLSDVNSTKNK